MKRLGLVLLALLLLVGCVALVACGGTSNNGDGENPYSAEDIRYVTEKGAKICTVSGRDYIKSGNGTAAVGLAYINGHTGPILVGLTANSVAYEYSYSGTKYVTKNATVEVGGKTYYYSLNEGFMDGKYVDYNSKLDIYCCTADTAEGAAKEIIALIDMAKFAAKKINTIEELKALSGSGDTFELGRDIDLSSVESWEPIEDFTGLLMGAGFKIQNLTINDVNTQNIGLFGTLTGTVENLVLENVSVTSRGNAGNAGAIAGTNKGTIIGCSVDGQVNPTYYNNVGGIVGYNDQGTIKKCTNKASVTGNEFVGGVCGNAVVSNIEHLRGNTNEGLVEGLNSVGGVAGMVTAPMSNATYTVTENENKNSVTGHGDNVGGVFGEVYGFHEYKSYTHYNNYFEISVLTNSGEVVGEGDNVGGIVGKCTRTLKLTVSENKADVTGGNCVGGLVGYAPDLDIDATGRINSNTITGKGKVGGFAGHAGIIENATNRGNIVSTALLVEDGKNRAYVGGIAGYCEGLVSCKNESDITVTTTGSYVGGLAGYVCISESNKLDKNKNTAAITGADHVGGIAGFVISNRVNATYLITDNKNEADIKGANFVGGIFGELYGFYEYYSYTHYNSYFEVSVLTNIGDVTGTGDKVGGLIGGGNHVSKITICENGADVTGENYVGGFVGYSPDTNIQATGVTNTNTITGKGYIGGFAGYAGLIENATNSGEILSTGIVVKDSKSYAYVGGIAGYCTGLLACTNTSDITVNTSGAYVGGLAGYVYVPETQNRLDRNVNSGKIKGADYVGGIAGYITCPRSNATYEITKNENRATVTGNDNVGGIFGYTYGFYEYYSYTHHNSYFQVTYCKNEAEITGNSNVGGIVGGHNHLKTEANIMDTNTTYEGNKLGQ